MNKPQQPHSLVLDSRRILSVTGVTDVISFDESSVVLAVNGGELNVGGTGLTVTKLSLENGEAAVTGNIEALYYSVPKEKKRFLSKLFN